MILVSLAVYTYTLAPTVVLEQSAAFSVAAQHLGIGRVPGYPLWHLLAHLFVKLFSFVSYRGNPNPAWACHFMSAFFGSLSCGVVALMTCRTSRLLTRSFAGIPAKVRAIGCSVSASLLFAFSGTMWSQSVIAETHTLTLFMILSFLTVLMLWMRNPRNWILCLLALWFGLGLSQSHFMIFLLPPALLGIGLTDWRIGRDLAVGLGVFFAVLLITRFLLGPPWLVLQKLCAAFLAMVIATAVLPNRRQVMLVVALSLLGLSLYMYLPLASEAESPMQFSYCRTWEGFMHAVTRGQYEKIKPTDIIGDPGKFIMQIGWYLLLLAHQYSRPIVLVGLLPIFWLLRFKRWYGRLAAVLLLTFAIYSIVVTAGVNPRLDIQDNWIQRVRFIPSFAIFAVFLGWGLTVLLETLVRSSTPASQIERRPD